MKAETYLAKILREKSVKLGGNGAKKVARQITEKQMLRSICESEKLSKH